MDIGGGGGGGGTTDCSKTTTCSSGGGCGGVGMGIIICLLCENSHVSADWGRRRREEFCDIQGLRLMFRYLKIDIICHHQPSNKEEWKGEDGDWDWGRIVKTLCDPCSLSVNKFLQIYHDFELVRMLMDECLQLMKERLEEVRRGGGEGGRTTSVPGGSLKMEFLAKCNLQLTSNPKVRLKHIEIPSCDPPANNIASKPPPVLDHRRQPRREAIEATCLSPPPAPTNETEAEAGEPMPEEPPELVNPPVEMKPSIIRRRGFVCRVCGKVFVTVRGLHLHMDLHHKKLLKYCCPHCHQICNGVRELKYHVVCTHPQQLFPDELQGASKAQLDSAIQQLQLEHNRIMGCTLCTGALVPGTFEWKTHILEVHRGIVVEMIQNQNQNCESQTASASNCRNHILRAGSENIILNASKSHQSHRHRPPSKCVHCGRVVLLSNQRSHMRRVHPHIFFSDKLPPGTTEGAVRAAIAKCFQLIEFQRDGDGTSSKKCHCPFCPHKFTKRATCTDHILTFHDDIVLSTLQLQSYGTSANTPPPPPPSMPTCSNLLEQLLSTPPPPETNVIYVRPSSSAKNNSIGILDTRAGTSNVAPAPPLLRQLLTSSSLPARRSTPTIPTIRKNYHAEIIPLNKIQCEYCSKISDNRTAHFLHQILEHSYHYFYSFNQLPSHTSKEVFDTTVQLMVKEAQLQVAHDEDMLFQCPMCNIFCRRESNYKLHILSPRHFDAVLARLQTTNTPSSSSSIVVTETPEPVLQEEEEEEDDDIMVLMDMPPTSRLNKAKLCQSSITNPNEDEEVLLQRLVQQAGFTTAPYIGGTEEEPAEFAVSHLQGLLMDLQSSDE